MLNSSENTVIEDIFVHKDNEVPIVSMEAFIVETDTVLDDFDLWEAFKQGDESAFMQVYNTHFETLCDFGIQFAAIHIVEDTVQDLFVYLRKKRKTLPIIKVSIKSYLFQCLKYRLYNIQKKMQRGHFLIPTDRFAISPCPETLIILDEKRREKIEKLNKVLFTLNDKQREVIYYYFYQNMSYDEVRLLLGYQKVKSVRSFIYKTLKRLKEDINIFL